MNEISMKKSGLLRLVKVSGVLPMLLGCSISQAAGYWVSESAGGGKEGALCVALHKRLNEMAKGSNPNCMYDAIESYPEFSEPPWEELNPRDHFELLVKLMKYAQEGGTRYFTGPALVTEAGYRKRAEDFITRSHGQMQVWRTSLLWDFVDLGKPRHEQSIVKLTYKDGTSASTEGCPAKGSHDWVRWTFIVSSDLSGPDPTINNGTGLFSPTSAWPVLYDGKAVLINTYSVHWPMASCMYKFVEPDTRESKEK